MVSDISASNLKYRAVAGESGSPYTALEFKVRDDGGTTKSGIDLDVTARTMTINVTATNLPPVLTPIGSKSVNEGQILSFNVTATDPDLDPLMLSASLAPPESGLPPHASFTDHGDGTGTFTFDPDYSQAGIYSVVFKASDGLLEASETVPITVNNVNRPPVLATIGPRSIIAGQTLTIDVSATDLDLDPLTLAANLAPPASGLPTHASFIDHGNGTASFTFTPDGTQLGVYLIVFKAFDGSLEDDETVPITVTSGQPCPEGMSHYWKFDEPVGQPYDDFYGTNDATCTVCPTPAAGYCWRRAAIHRRTED